MHHIITPLDPSLRDNETISQRVRQSESRRESGIIVANDISTFGVLDFSNLREEPTREEIMITSLAISLRDGVQQGSISQAEANRRLDEYRRHLQCNPFPPDLQVFMSARLDREAIIAAHPLVDYCRAHGLELRREGREWVRCCPLHKERTPSFKVNPEKQLFHCHGCDAGGSVIDLHALLNGMSIGEAMRELGEGRQQRSHKEIAVYTYCDEDGYGLFEVVRFFPKDFRQFKLDEKGKRIWKGGMANAHPADQLRELRRHSQVQAVFAARSRSAEPERVDDPRRSLVFTINRKKNFMNPNPATYDVPTGLSNLLSDYDEAHWEVVVFELKPASGVLLRGSVLALVGGKCELVTGTNQATVFGILLDEAVDTSAAYSDASVTGSIARAGSFRAQALIVSPGTDPAALQSALRDIGIFIHGVLVVPTAAEAEAPAESQ